MKNLKQWVQELPAGFRDELGPLLENSTVRFQFENTVGFLDYVISEMDKNPEDPKLENIDVAKYRSLRRQYAEGFTSVFHVSYWQAKDMSHGDNVDAFNIAHAVDIILARTGLSEDQIIYVHSKDSKFKK
jgi:hypothetical protein